MPKEKKENKEKDVTGLPEVEDIKDLIAGLSYALNVTLKLVVNNVKESKFSSDDIRGLALSTYLAKVAEAHLRGVVDMSLASEIASAEMQSCLKDSKNAK